MQKTFYKNIDLERLTKQMALFFEARRFEDITAVKNAAGCQIVAGDSQKYKIKSDLKVDVREEAEGFSVSLEPSKELKKFNYPVMLATFFGGGYFFLKDLKSDESWRKIEREFWHEVDLLVMRAEETSKQSHMDEI